MASDRKQSSNKGEEKSSKEHTEKSKYCLHQTIDGEFGVAYNSILDQKLIALE